MVLFSLARSLLFSLALHALVILAGFWMILGRPLRKAPTQPTWVTLETAPMRVKSEEDKTRSRIVQTDLGKVTKDVPREAFLGEKNQVFDQETVSRKKLVEMGGATQQQKTPEFAREEPQSEAQKKVARLGLALPAAEDRSRLRGEPATPRWTDFSGALPQDYVKGLKERKDALNTREFVFFSYFQRIRSRLDQAWVPILRERLTQMYRNGRSLASDQDHVTKVMVILSKRRDHENTRT